MSYVQYNQSLYRTGFRPYGTTDTFAASHGLSGVGQSHAFSPYLLHGLGQQKPFTETGGFHLHGLGDGILSLEVPGTGQTIQDLLNAGYTPQEIEQLFGDVGNLAVVPNYPGPLPPNPYAPRPATVALPPGLPQQPITPGLSEMGTFLKQNWPFLALALIALNFVPGRRR